MSDEMPLLGEEELNNKRQQRVVNVSGYRETSPRRRCSFSRCRCKPESIVFAILIYVAIFQTIIMAGLLYGFIAVGPVADRAKSSLNIIDTTTTNINTTVMDSVARVDTSITHIDDTVDNVETKVDQMIASLLGLVASCPGITKFCNSTM